MITLTLTITLQSESELVKEWIFTMLEMLIININNCSNENTLY